MRGRVWAAKHPLAQPLFCFVQSCARRLPGQFATVEGLKKTDGISLDDVRGALAIREAYVKWGQVYQRSVGVTRRAEVFRVKGDRCVICNAPATDVDHIVSNFFGDDSLANLRPLCRECHLEKTLASPIPWDTTDPEAVATFERRTAAYETRCGSPEPLRRCDDEEKWPQEWQQIKRDRRATRALASLDQLLGHVLEAVATKVGAGVTFEDAWSSELDERQTPPDIALDLGRHLHELGIALVADIAGGGMEPLTNAQRWRLRHREERRAYKATYRARRRFERARNTTG